MAVLAVQQIRRMRGGAQGHLMLGADGQLWVVKFQNNPQHTRVLANEMLATRLAAAAGLTVPETAVVEVSKWLIRNTPELEVDLGPGLGRGRVPCAAGLQFGARYVGGLMPGQVVDYLPEEEIGGAAQPGGVCRRCCAWTSGRGTPTGGRRCLTRKAQGEAGIARCFIDQGYCFHAGEWRFEDAPLRGVYPRNAVYAWVDGWRCFEPWLTRLETMDATVVWRAAEEIPPEWYGEGGKAGDMAELEALVAGLLERRGRIRELVEAFARSGREPFPKWVGMGKRMAM